ncbi:MAG: microcin ABC transporter permease, partial [Alphaproteobacteria bacterium]|nr:microcin ABC transporter permease [Alphaproteobacteria bacterium]
MVNYILRRLLLMIPTIFGIMLVSFAIIQFAPGGPIERIIAQLQGHEVSATARFSGGGADMAGNNQLNQTAYQASDSKYRGAQGLDPDFIAELERQFGFDKPAHERFFKMLSSYLVFDFGNSYYRDMPVLELIIEKL